MRLVLDAGVSIASLCPREPGHHAARARLRRIAAREDVAIVPALFVTEVAGALARLGFAAPSIETLLAALPSAPVTTIRPKRALAVARCAIATKLRGADAIYVWPGAREGRPLCTLDRQIIARGPAACRVVAP